MATHDASDPPALTKKTQCTPHLYSVKRALHGGSKMQCLAFDIADGDALQECVLGEEKEYQAGQDDN